MWPFLKIRRGSATEEIQGGAHMAKERLLSERRRRELADVGLALRHALMEILAQGQGGKGQSIGTLLESSFDVQPSKLEGSKFKVMFVAEVGEAGETPPPAGKKRRKTTSKKATKSLAR